jgi:uncharacterized protein (DUF2164 family)
MVRRSSKGTHSSNTILWKFKNKGEKSMYIRLPRENKEQIISNLKDYFYNDRSEEIGDLAAENLLDFVLKEIGPYFYNQGVKDAKELCDQKMISLDEDIQSLERPILHKRN